MTLKELRGATLALGVLIVGVSLTGCVQMPTEKQSVESLKPQISFRLANESAGYAVVVLDGLQVGAAGQFQTGRVKRAAIFASLGKSCKTLRNVWYMSA